MYNGSKKSFEREQGVCVMGGRVELVAEGGTRYMKCDGRADHTLHAACILSTLVWVLVLVSAHNHNATMRTVVFPQQQD